MPENQCYFDPVCLKCSRHLPRVEIFNIDYSDSGTITCRNCGGDFIWKKFASDEVVSLQINSSYAGEQFNNMGQSFEIKFKDPNVKIKRSKDINYRKNAANNLEHTSVDNLIDIDGNSYRCVRIGEQVWMAENLRTTRLIDGSAIQCEYQETTYEEEVEKVKKEPYVKKYFGIISVNKTKITKYKKVVVKKNRIRSPIAEEWEYLKVPACTYYDGNENNKSKYGLLYNWYTVQTGKLAPIGWHVPTVADFNKLATACGGEDLAGPYLKSIANWSDGGNGNNKSGFSALPGGNRYSNSAFNNLTKIGYWWSSSKFGTSKAINCQLSAESNELVIMDLLGSDIWEGYSIRLIRD